MLVFSGWFPVQLAGMTIGSFNHGANRRGRNIGEAEMAEMTFPRVVNPLFRPVSHQKALIFISMFDSVSGQDFSYLGSCSLSINAYIFSSTFFQFQWVIYPRFVVEKAGYSHVPGPSGGPRVIPAPARVNAHTPSAIGEVNGVQLHLVRLARPAQPRSSWTRVLSVPASSRKQKPSRSRGE